MAAAIGKRQCANKCGGAKNHPQYFQCLGRADHTHQRANHAGFTATIGLRRFGV